MHGINDDLKVAELEIHGNSYPTPLEALLRGWPTFSRAALGKAGASGLEAKIAEGLLPAV